MLNWNGVSILPRCLACLRGTAFASFRVILADNASSDGSLDLVRRDFPEADVLQFDRNYGFAEGNNRAIQWAFKHHSPRYLALLNNDAFVDPDWLCWMVRI